ncbi:tetratricopeptide repeat protein [Kitasatospora purpeofusca]|uniref:tetratricopeptide repeat protein n=1 Tax=Kitasatospora purpeofusca TaxID=67352 RepID=UPI003F4AF3B9
MARNTPNQHLKEMLLEADWTAGQLAGSINSEGRTQGLDLRYDRTSVAHWLSGSRPRPPVPQLAAIVLARRLRRPVLAEDTGLAQDTAEPGPVAAAAGPTAGDDPLVRLIALTRADVLPGTRSALTRMPYVPLAVAQPAWSAPTDFPAQAAGDAAQPRNTGVRHLREMIAIFGRQMDHHGGGHARSALVAYLGEDVAVLLSRPTGEALRRDLLTHTAQLTHLLANMTADTDRHALAQRHLLTALDLAHRAHDRRTCAITLRALSLQALERGHPHVAADLADAAVRTAPHVAGATRAFLLVQRGLTHAHGGRRREALGDLGDAEHHHTPSPEGQGPFATYPRASFHYQRGEILLALNELPQALLAFESSARHRPSHDHRLTALTQARRAETLLRMGHLDAAGTAWDTFLQHYPLLRSTRADHALGRLQAGLRPHARHRRAAHLLEVARAVSRAKAL